MRLEQDEVLRFAIGVRGMPLKAINMTTKKFLRQYLQIEGPGIYST